MIEAGDGALAHIWIGNGYTEDEAYSSYETKAPQLLVGEISEPFKKALEGHKVGSRVAVAATAEDAFGEGGNPQLGIGNKDGVVFVVDLMAGSATSRPARSGRPRSGRRAWSRPTASSPASTSPTPTSRARTSSTPPWSRATAPVVESGQTIAVNYLGQVYDAKEPFDESYSKDPTSFPIGVGQVVPGWDKGLVGKTVGSRVDPVHPAGRRLRRQGQRGAPGSRAPTRCSSSSTSSPPPDRPAPRRSERGERHGREVRAADQPLHHAARPDPLHLQAATSGALTTVSTPTTRAATRRSRRPSSGTRRTCASSVS